MKGTVKWFNNDKGYGYIVVESGVEHYFNVKDIQGTTLPSNGDAVEFLSKPGRKGPHAKSVVIIKQSQGNDSRVTCPQCGKKIVPRVNFYHGKPNASFCPYCACKIKDFSNCFIATTVYGDYNCSEVLKLRAFRDNRLLTNQAGRIFVKTYYKLSPPLAEGLNGYPRMSGIIKNILDVIVRFLP